MFSQIAWTWFYEDFSLAPNVNEQELDCTSDDNYIFSSLPKLIRNKVMLWI